LFIGVTGCLLFSKTERNKSLFFPWMKEKVESKDIAPLQTGRKI